MATLTEKIKKKILNMQQGQLTPPKPRGGGLDKLEPGVATPFPVPATQFRPVGVRGNLLGLFWTKVTPGTSDILS